MSSKKKTTKVTIDDLKRWHCCRFSKGGKRYDPKWAEMQRQRRGWSPAGVDVRFVLADGDFLESDRLFVGLHVMDPDLSSAVVSFINWGILHLARTMRAAGFGADHILNSLFYVGCDEREKLESVVRSIASKAKGDVSESASHLADAVSLVPDDETGARTAYAVAAAVARSAGAVRGPDGKRQAYVELLDVVRSYFAGCKWED